MIDELYHFGIPGIKWGKRKAVSVSTDGSALRAYKQAKNKRKEALRNKEFKQYDFDKAYKIYKKTYSKDKESMNRNFKKLESAATESVRADKEYKAAKKAEKAAKKMAKVEAKAVKKMYKQLYMEGKSAVGKVWTKITDTHTAYANRAYIESKGAFDPSLGWPKKKK